MKKIKTILAILPALLFSCAGDDVEKYIPPTPIAPSEPGEEVVYHKRAKEQFDLINQCYRINSGATEGLYNENYPKKDGDNSASFLWPYDGLVSGAAALHALGYDVNYADMVEHTACHLRGRMVRISGNHNKHFRTRTSRRSLQNGRRLEKVRG